MMSSQSTAVQPISRGRSIIGFDLGHGESALAMNYLGGDPSPVALHHNFRRSFITAVARQGEKLVIGEQALAGMTTSDLCAAFKSPRLDDPEVRSSTTLFVQGILANLGAEIASAAEVVVGCPSGWDAETRNKYEALLQEAGLPHLKLLPESRAAFLHTRALNPQQFGEEVLGGSVLVIDVGSSTTDFTHVIGLNEAPVDFGHVTLGASSIDRLIFERSRTRSPHAKRLDEVFQIDPKWKTRCELFCRKAKEEYFRTGDGSDIKLIGEARLVFEVALTSKDMDEVLATPLPELGGKTWPEAYRATLESVREKIRGNAPRVVIMTGGASAMPFVQQITQEIFADAEVAVGKEPDLAIAKGLALAARIDHDTAGFLRDVHTVLHGEKLRGVVQKHVPDLFTQVANTVATPAVNVLIAAIAHWRTGKFDTLNEAGQASARKLADWMHSADGRAAVRAALAPWFAALAQDVANLTTPVCNAYKLQPAVLELPPHWAVGGEHIQHADFGKIIEDALHETDPVLLGLVDLITDVFSGDNFFDLLFGTLSLILLGIVNAVASLFGYSVSKAALDSDIPMIVRNRINLENLEAKLRERRGEIEQAIREALEKKELAANVVAHVTAALAQQIEHRARAAQLLIRSGRAGA